MFRLRSVPGCMRMTTSKAGSFFTREVTKLARLGSRARPDKIAVSRICRRHVPPPAWAREHATARARELESKAAGSRCRWPSHCQLAGQGEPSATGAAFFLGRCFAAALCGSLPLLPEHSACQGMSQLQWQKQAQPSELQRACKKARKSRGCSERELGARTAQLLESSCKWAQLCQGQRS